MKKRLKAIDFFCSGGGVTCGFKQAGINVLGGIDIDPACKITYERNNHAKYLCADVSNLEKEKVAKLFKIKKNQKDLIFVGCSPCQYYSNIKTDKRKSEKTRLLLADFQEFVDYYRPGYVFIENVPGLDHKPESPLGQFKQFLRNAGYIFDDSVVNAKYYGVPQNRRRYILLATCVKNKIELPKGCRTKIKTVRQTIGDYSKFKPIKNGFIDNSGFLHSAARLSALNLKRIQATPHDGGGRLTWKGSSIDVQCYKNHDGHTDVYGRMYWNRPSPTITTRFISYSNGRYGHPEQDRAISLREGAALQSFPQDYVFYSDSQGTIAKMIGNAVPPLLAKAVGEELSK
ncbi:MAG: DNA cytosine methyltransferase [Bacteroidales bacterium]|jgi:DNA (cytosine-5)-methyltransferase 1|nr:DNA cytosine methyltransferase [Bacteroidales bacterium]